MADNTFNFDLDAPAVPTLTLDPTPAEEEKAAPAQQEAAAPEQPQVNLTPEEQAMVDQFAEKIDITNSQQVLQYGSACQKKIGDFSEAALSKVATKDLGEVGDMITSLIGELKSFDAGEEEKKGILGFFKKKGDQLDAMKMKYNKAETNVEKIQSMLEGHQVQLLKDIAMLDKMYDLNMAYFKELSMYILAGKKKLAGTGDELQGIKRGIMEMADGIVINKADGDNVERARLAAAQFRNALHLFPAPESGWTPQVLTYSGFYNIGVKEIWDMVYQYIDFVKANGYFDYRRNEQSKYWMYESINEHLKDSFYHNPKIQSMLADREQQVLQGNLTSFVAAKSLLDTYFEDLRSL